MSFAALDCERVSVDLALTAARERVPVLERELMEALGRQLAAALAPFANGRDDGASLFLDRLVIAEAIGGKWDPEVIVRKVAARIAAAVSAEIDSGGGMRFRDRTEFVAALLAALADGSAWSRWWFAEFEGFKALSASNALRSVVLAEEETGFAALARLTADAARRVIDSMAPADAARIVAALRARESRAAADAELLWRRSAALHADIADAPQRWLEVLIECGRGNSNAASDETVSVLQAMRTLRESAEAASRGMAPEQREDERAFLMEIADRLGIASTWLATAPVQVLREICRDIEARAAAPRAVPSTWTDWGGAFLLASTLARLDWFDGWRGSLDDSKMRSLALAVVAQSLAPASARQLAVDEALTNAFAVVDLPAALRKHRRSFTQALLATLARPSGTDSKARAPRRTCGALAGGALGAALTSAAAALMAEFAQRVPGLDGSSADYIRQNLLDLPACVTPLHSSCEVSLGRAPLDVLLVLAGLKRTEFSWPGAPQLRLSGDCAP